MKSPDESSKLDEILAGGRLSGPQYDEIWDKVLERVETLPAPPARRRFWPFLALGGALASAFAGWLILADRHDDHFAVRGGPSARSAAFVIGCASSGRAFCRPGETLMFSVNTAHAAGFLGAYAEPVDRPAGGRLWYFPSESGDSPVVSPGSGTKVLGQGIQIGPEQPPGRYRVTVWTSPKPVRRTEVDDDDIAAGGARTTLDLEVGP